MDIFSAFSGLSTLQGSIRIYFICFFLILPFWFVDLMLFSETFYKNHTVYLNLLVAFCIAICWFWTLICCLVNLSLTDDFHKAIDTKVESFILYWVTILSIPILGLSTFIFSYLDLSFKTVMIITFVVGCAVTPIAKIIIKYRFKQAEKRNTKS
jgi:hypothetical protein